MRRPGALISRENARLLPLFGPVAVAAAAALVAAAVSFAASGPSAAVLAGVLALALAATFVEAYPVPIEGISSGGVSLTAVFIVGAAVIYGWAPAVMIGFLARGVIELVQRRPPVRLVYNSAVYALGGLAAGCAAALVGDEGGVARLFLAVILAAAGFYAVNIPLTAGIIARWSREPFLPLLHRSIISTIGPFSIMASVSLMLAVLWDRSPFLATALVGPLVAIALYQRSVHSALKAMRLALTDPLTGLGNHRHFHERLEHDLARAREDGFPLTLVLLDIDDFKQINDRYGHPVGDRALAQIAQGLRQGGEAFRVGGDEFALLLAGRDAHEGLTVARSVVERVAETDLDCGDSLSMSAGIASYPQHGVDRGELVRVADNALYLAKEQGKNTVRVYRPDVIELAELRRLAEGPDRAARLRAAASLAHAVDARDAYTGSHSYMVGELAARVAHRMGLDSESVELTRLAGSLHDLGKLAIPEEILRKPGPLNEAERLVLERHPQIGFRMLDSLGIEPVATWVLHHHERWDGTGYPDRREGPEIPLGARILFVADAYDAMTTDRVYRGRLSHDRAIAELERCAGTQFDPGVVAAFRAEFDEPRLELVVAESA
ncbi:MAG TPA: diguanylate cyclase [Gaiellaceae bacterium]|nr:diguanylate cyclase [Gaiellaceae bacterium]